MRDNRRNFWHHCHVALITDTYGFIKGLIESGIPEKQAEAIAAGFHGFGSDELATKDDLELVLAQLETRLTIRTATFIGIGVAAQSAIIAAIQILGG